MVIYGMRPTAHSLLLQVFSVGNGQAMPVRALVDVAKLFGITENNLRVTLARLFANGLISRDERGQYRLAERGRAVQSHVAEWRRLDDRLVPWDGAWIGVHLAGIPRSNRTSMRRQMRALDFLGLRTLAPDLWVRPDNLAGGVADVRRRLQELGLAPEALVFALHDLDDAATARARELWDMQARRAEYAQLCGTMARASARVHTLPLEEAMVETFLLGGRVLRLLAFDPLLPDAISPGTERRALVHAMLEYDRGGRRAWTRFMRVRNAPEFDSLLQFPSFDAAGRPPTAAGSLA